MGIGFLFWEYIAWHYGKALGEIVGVARNLFRFGLDFFSFRLLLRTWISPWYQMREGHDSDLTNLESLGVAMFGNFLLRFIGFILRTFVLTLGVLFEVSVALSLSFVLIVWILFPVVFIALLTAAIKILL